jgi:hypothetical protein
VNDKGRYHTLKRLERGFILNVSICRRMEPQRLTNGEILALASALGADANNLPKSSLAKEMEA